MQCESASLFISIPYFYPFFLCVSFTNELHLCFSLLIIFQLLPMGATFPIQDSSSAVQPSPKCYRSVTSIPSLPDKWGKDLPWLHGKPG